MNDKQGMYKANGITPDQFAAWRQSRYEEERREDQLLYDIRDAFRRLESERLAEQLRWTDADNRFLAECGIQQVLNED